LFNLRSSAQSVVAKADFESLSDFGIYLTATIAGLAGCIVIVHSSEIQFSHVPLHHAGFRGGNGFVPHG
jgi:hypothetical protein